MLLTIPQLKTLSAALDAARLASDGPGNGLYCLTAHDNARWEPKPRKKVGDVLRDGTPVEAMPDGQPGVKVPASVHGRGHLGVDPATGTVRCVLCEGKA
jgi:hypothetical protein